MLSDIVIPADKGVNTLCAVNDVLVSLDVDVLILDRPPEPFDIDVVQGAPLAIHGGFRRAPLVVKQFRKPLRCVLAALIRVEHFRPAILAHGFQEYIHAEVRRQRVGQFPREYPAAVPVDDCGQVDEPVLQADVGEYTGAKYTVKPE